MANLHDIAANPDGLLALEPEELALFVLQSIVEQEKQRTSGVPCRVNFSRRFQDHPEAVNRAIMEAWAWLETSGAIAQLPDHDEGRFFVTRRGHELAKIAKFRCFHAWSDTPAPPFASANRTKGLVGTFVVNMIRQSSKHSSKLRSPFAMLASFRTPILE